MARVHVLSQHRVQETPLSEQLSLPGICLFFPVGSPVPQVTDRRDPDPSRMQMPQGNPLLLSYTLQELLARDTVQVELIPEKKGLFLKHVEYEVSSQVTADYLCDCADKGDGELGTAAGPEIG